MVHLVVVSCVLRAVTEKRSSTFLRKKNCTPEKILVTPMNLSTPGKNPAVAHARKYN